ncbi:hypothetical protein ACOSQ4_005201 [Xanthoceras sorbifolium]
MPGAGLGGEDPFGWWFHPSSSLETTNQRNCMNNHSYQSNITAQNHFMWGIQPTQNPNTSPNILVTTPQPPNHLLPLPNNLLQSPGLQNSTTHNHLIDMRYNHVNPPREGSSNGSADYGMHLNTNPGFDHFFNIQSLETGLSRLNLSTPSRPSDQYLGTSSDSLFNNGFSHPSYGFNNVFDNGFQYMPYPIDNQVNNDLQSGLERLRTDSAARGQSGFHARNRMGSVDLCLRRSSENNDQYHNIQNVSRRNSYPELSRPASSCLSCINNTSNGFPRPRRNHHLSSDDLNREYPFRSRLDLVGSQRSGGRSVNGSSSFSSNVSLSSLFENHHSLIKPRSQHRTYSLEELRGRVCSVARDPQARGFLEEKVGERDQTYIELIFSEVKNELLELIVDHSANHLMQKLVLVLNEDQMDDFILIIINSERRLLGICDDSSGTYVMQRLLEGSLTPTQKSLIVSALKKIAGVLSKTQYGHHVIMHCLRRFSNEFTKGLVEEITVNSVDLATNKSGCCVLQHCLEHVNEGEQKGQLIAEIVANALILSGDAFGNYVVQNVLDNIPQVINDVVEQLARNYFTLSMSRFGSNVVEKCLKSAGEDQSTAIMIEIMTHPDFLELVKDNYGNYVVQSMWNLSQGRPFIRQTLFSLIQSNSLFLRSHMYGRRVVATIMGSRR